MGEVLALHVPLDAVEEAYQALAHKSGVRGRPQQKMLSRAVRDALVLNRPLVAEAPTGTGKTLSYLIGALAAWRENEAPIVVATATVGLQEQVVSGDIPKLVDAGLIQKHEVVLAKGRGRYFCVSAAERLAKAGVKNQFDIFDQEVNTQVEETAGLPEMLEHFNGKAWDGDIDSWKGTRPVFWAQVQANSDTCTKKACPQYDECAFYRARMRLLSAKVIVSNHDLVLSDLKQAKEEVDTVFPFLNYRVIFDEAHHLPDKAMGIGQGCLDLKQMEQTLAALPSWASSVHQHPVIAKALDKECDFGVFEHVGPMRAALDGLVDAVLVLELDDNKQHIFEGGELPSVVQARAMALLGEVSLVEVELNKASLVLKSQKLHEALHNGPKDPLQLLGGLTSLLAWIRQAKRGLDGLVVGEHPVKWLDTNHDQLYLNTSPTDGSEVLTELLWEPNRATPVMVSATLRDFEGFERYSARIGLPEGSATLSVDPVFPYEECSLVLAGMEFSPKMAERRQFMAELNKKLPKSLLPNEGSLVLMPSWSMLKQCLPALKAKFGDKLLVQGTMPLRHLVDIHKDRIDRGQGSVLVGAATMAEGLDLPGAYCTHVVIVALPFSTPTDPIERERARQMGSQYFSKQSLPDALVRLVQMTGRLMRRESDRGRITVFDKRMYSTSYGKRMLKALPPYRIVQKNFD